MKGGELKWHIANAKAMTLGIGVGIVRIGQHPTTTNPIPNRVLENFAMSASPKKTRVLAVSKELAGMVVHARLF